MTLLLAEVYVDARNMALADIARKGDMLPPFPWWDPTWSTTLQAWYPAIVSIPEFFRHEDSFICGYLDAAFM